MPQALVPIFTAIGVSAGTAAIIANIVVTVLINVALGAISKALTKTPKVNVPPINVTVRNPVENRRIVFGTVRVGGVFAFYGTSGDNNKFLWYVVVLAGHQCHDIKDVWLDTVRVADGDINAGNPAGGVVGGSSVFNGKLWIYKHLGTSAQTVDTNIDADFTAWTTNHRLRGCPYLVVKMERDDEKYPSGAPQSVTALMDGALCYDQREPTHDPDDPSTWEFTRNPALHTQWVVTGGSVHNDISTRLVMYGLQEDYARVPDAYIIAAANICDESISGANAPPSGAQPRYRCDIELSTGETRREWIEDILATMAGSMVVVRGEYRVYAGAYDSPTHDLSQDDLYGALECEDTYDHQRRYNAVAAVYRNAAAEYTEATTPFRTDAAYETQDGGRQIPIEIDLRGVTDQYQAQRLAEIKKRKSRMMRSVKLVGALNLLKVALNETLNYTHVRWSWSNRVFRCVERQFEFNEEAGRVSLTCEREDPGVYTDMLTADYETGTSTTGEFTNDTPDAPTGLAATGIPGAVLLTVTLPTYFKAGSVVEIWEYTSDTPFASAVKVTEGSGNILSVIHHDRLTRFYWSRIRDPKGVVSATFPTTTGVAGAGAVNGNRSWSVDSTGKPAGIRAVEGITDRSQVQFGGSGIQILSTPDTAVGYGFPAIPINDAETYQLTIRHKSSATSADGLYLRFWETNAALPAGKTHVGQGSGEGVGVTGTGYAPQVENGPMPGTTMVESTYTYTPTAGTKFASFSLYNWDPATPSVVYEVEWVHLTRTGSNVNLLSNGSKTTEDLNDGAATDLYFDQDDHGGAAFGSGATVLSITLTPPVDSDIEVSALADADTVFADGGNHLRVTVTPTAGSTTIIGTAGSAGTTRDLFPIDANYSALGGQEITIELETFVSASSIHVWTASLRLAVVKR